MDGRKAELPGGLLTYKRTPIFDEKTMPAGLRRRHGTKLRVRGLIRVIEGRFLYRILGSFLGERPRSGESRCGPTGATSRGGAARAGAAAAPAVTFASSRNARTGGSP
jgi:Domain of unknown function (DUF1971)